MSSTPSPSPSPSVSASAVSASAVSVPLRGRHANVLGCGLIGGSVGLALRAEGWFVTGVDRDPAAEADALEVGAVDVAGALDPDAELTVIAAPVGVIPELARAALAASRGIVTDVGSVKSPIVESVGDPRFVGGHPMAGSEALGVRGARADLFDGATWVLTPTRATDPAGHALVHSVVSGFGAEVVTLPAARHDEFVALVSHVPHLTAVSLMGLAAGRSEEHRALLRLAAGGFRDMTRIAAGSPGIWPDICAENRTAILGVLDELLGTLEEVRRVVAEGDRAALLARLETAQRARRNLPVSAGLPERLAEVRVHLPDRPGQFAAVTTLATELGVNVYDLEVAHSAEVPGGVGILVVDRDLAAAYVAGLTARGFRASEHVL